MLHYPGYAMLEAFQKCKALLNPGIKNYVFKPGLIVNKVVNPELSCFSIQIEKDKFEMKLSEIFLLHSQFFVSIFAFEDIDQSIQ